MKKFMALWLISIIAWSNITAQNFYSYISIFDNKVAYGKYAFNPNPGWCTILVESGIIDLLSGEKIVSPFKFKDIFWLKNQNRYLAYEENDAQTDKDVVLMDKNLKVVAQGKFSLLLTPFSKYFFGLRNGVNMLYDENFKQVPMMEGLSFPHGFDKEIKFIINKKSSPWIFLDTNLKEIARYSFEKMQNYNSYPVFKKDGNYYLMDASAQIIGKPIRSIDFPRYNGDLIFIKDSITKLFGAVDTNQNIIVPFKYQDITPIGNFYRLYNPNSELKYIDKMGKELPKGINRVYNFIKDSLYTQDNRSLNVPDSIVDNNGISIFKNISYDKIFLGSAMDEPILVVKNGLPYFYKLNGEQLIIPRLTNAAPFVNGYAYTWFSRKMGIINKAGKIVLSPIESTSWKQQAVIPNFLDWVCDYLKNASPQTITTVPVQINEPTKVFAVDAITGQKSNVVMYYVKGGVVYARDGFTGNISNTKLKFIVGNTVYAVDALTGQRSNTILYYIENGVVYASDAITGQKTNIPLRYIENKIVYASDAITHNKTNVILRYIEGGEITD